jgi:NitT/TauT family transport system substrate-binding protein
MTTVLRIATGTTGFNWLPIFLAERRGAFAGAGLTIEPLSVGTVDRATAAVRSGEAELAVTPPEGAIAGRAAGGRLKLIAGNVNRLPLSLIAHPRFQTIEALRGAVLGTSSLTEGTALYTMEVLRRHGLKYPGDYTFDVVGVHPARWAALQDGRIDAAVQLIPLNLVAEDAGYRNLGEASDYIPEIIFAAFIADEGRAEELRPELVAFLRCLMEASRALYDEANDAELQELIAETAKAEGPYARRCLDYVREKQVFPTDLAIPEAAFAKTLELMALAGVADDIVIAAASKALDDSFRREAAGLD